MVTPRRKRRRRRRWDRGHGMHRHSSGGAAVRVALEASLSTACCAGPDYTAAEAVPFSVAQLIAR